MPECDMCAGAGWVNPWDDEPCEECDGTGEVSVVRADETQGDTDDRGHMPTR